MVNIAYRALCHALRGLDESDALELGRVFLPVIRELEADLKQCKESADAWARVLEGGLTDEGAEAAYKKAWAAFVMR